jgi:hypothetical protein
MGKIWLIYMNSKQGEKLGVITIHGKVMQGVSLTLKDID